MENISFETEFGGKLRTMLTQWREKIWSIHDIYLNSLVEAYGEDEARRRFSRRWSKPRNWTEDVGWPPLITDDDFSAAMEAYICDHHRMGEPLNMDCLIPLIVQRAKNTNLNLIDLAEVGQEGSDLNDLLGRDIVDCSVFGGSAKIRIVSEDDNSRHTIRLQTAGFGSAAAHKESAVELGYHALSILKTFQLVELVDCGGVELDEFTDRIQASSVPLDLTGTSESADGYFLSLPVVLHHFKWLFELFLGQRIANKQNKDPLARRIATACLFLCEADQANAAPMRAAATFAAIEALVGRKSDQTEHIARRAMTLVEPRRENRHNLKRAFKRLYDARCDIVHGNSFTAEQSVVTRARLLAAVLLFAVLERFDMARKSGEQLNYDQYLSEVDEAADTGREIPPGIAPDSRRIAFHDTLCRLLEP